MDKRKGCVFWYGDQVFNIYEYVRITECGGGNEMQDM
jgi:hypothetical protein